MPVPEQTISEYERAAAAAALRIWWIKLMCDPLGQSAARFGRREVNPPRPTEDAAGVLWRDGYIPGGAYTGNEHWTSAPFAVEIDFRWVGAVTPHRKAVGKVCPECRQRYPNTPDFWHKNGDGLQSICKSCRNKQERARIAHKREVLHVP